MKAETLILFFLLVATWIVMTMSHWAGLFLLTLSEVLIYCKIPVFITIRGDIFSEKPIAIFLGMEPRLFRLIAFLCIAIFPYFTVKKSEFFLLDYWFFCSVIERVIIFLNDDRETKEKLSAKSGILGSVLITIVFIAIIVMLVYK